MIQRMIDAPWITCSFLFVLCFLYLSAGVRIRRENRRKIAVRESVSLLKATDKETLIKVGKVGKEAECNMLAAGTNSNGRH